MESALALLPETLDDQDSDSKIEQYFAAVEELLETHDPEATGQTTIFILRYIINEINTRLDDDAVAKQGLVQKLSLLPWFKQNQQQVRYAANQNKIGISAKPGISAAKSSAASSSGSANDLGQAAAEPEEKIDFLPITAFKPNATTEFKVDFCAQAAEDIVNGHDEASTGQSMVFMLRGLLKECNEILGDDAESKKGLAEKLGTMPWFTQNEQQVRYSVNNNTIGISKKNSGVSKKGQPKQRGPPQLKGPPQKRPRPNSWKGKGGGQWQAVPPGFNWDMAAQAFFAWQNGSW